MEKTWASYGTIFGLLAFIQTIVHTFLPPEFKRGLGHISQKVLHFFSNYVYLRVDEYDGFSRNELYYAVQLHLSQYAATAARNLNLALPKNASAPTYSLDENEFMIDKFQGGTVHWEFKTNDRRSSTVGFWDNVPDEKRSLHLRMHKKHREKILTPYVQHILEHAEEIKRKSRDRLLYTNSKSSERYSRKKVWESVPLKHPSTFETLALDPATKKTIMEDLSDFAKGEEFYKRAGRAWKRGYLLYGPPGTGKSSMIAAMANFLEYDVYDLELTEVKSNAELRNLLLRTTNKSIIVIEDIDCSLDFSERAKKPSKTNKSEDDKLPAAPGDGQRSNDEASKVTLSGLLNFTDGLWSCCGSERLIVFTTNHKEKLDPALLRSGRMDMHILLSYCTYEAFKVLARNYLGIEEHELFGEVEEAMEGAEITPADVSEVLIKEKRDPTKALRRLVSEVEKSKEAAAAKLLKIEEEPAAEGKISSQVEEAESTPKEGHKNQVASKDDDAPSSYK